MFTERRLSHNSLALVAAVFCIVFMIRVLSFPAKAAEPTFSIKGQVCELEGKGNYEFSGSETEFVSSDEAAVMGSLSVTGMAKENGDVNGMPFFTVKNGNLSLQYTVDQSRLNLGNDVWHLTEDSSKNVNGIKLSEKIGLGAIIVQTSLDGDTWVTDTSVSNIFSTGSSLKDPFYQTKDVQLDNGCYFRVIVVHKWEIQTGEKKIGFLSIPETDEKKYVEIYSFYAESGDPSRNITNSDATPRKELGQKVSTKKDKGYDGGTSVDIKDPHFGWELGKFIVNGYTRDTEDKGVPVFLKNVGDKVVLWFKLEQDIYKLNGDSALSIAEDKDGYDKHFEVTGTNFKHGTLIIQYTDKTGKKHTPVVYSDFLAANTKTGADTRVQLFEEGDYEVSLDYEIKNSPRKVGGVSVIPTYTDYKISFQFKIRNGNCMVYPFDIVSGNELSDHSWTKDGFQLDMARSRYLTIDVKRSSISIGADGQIKEDVRFNRPAQDGEKYTDEGIYTFTVKNLYTNADPVTKTIYVGENRVLKALSYSNMSIAELNAKLAAGAVIDNSGKIKTS